MIHHVGETDYWDELDRPKYDQEYEDELQLQLAEIKSGYAQLARKRKYGKQRIRDDKKKMKMMAISRAREIINERRKDDILSE